MQLLVQWEDEVANRQVQFSVDYSIEHAKLTIDQVIPTKVFILDRDADSAKKSIGVHTQKGRQLLVDQFTNSGRLEELTLEIGRRNGLLIAV